MYVKTQKSPSPNMDCDQFIMGNVSTGSGHVDVHINSLVAEDTGCRQRWEFCKYCSCNARGVSL